MPLFVRSNKPTPELSLDRLHPWLQPRLDAASCHRSVLVSLGRIFLHVSLGPRTRLTTALLVQHPEMLVLVLVYLGTSSLCHRRMSACLTTY